MPIELFKSEFGITWVNYDTDKMWRTHWLKLDDNTNSPGSNRNCGSRCTRHEFTLKSEKTQMVIVSANTWQDRGYPNSCKNGATRGSKRHVIEVQGHGTATFQHGNKMMSPFQMQAGQEINVVLEMDYNRAMAKDVSVVVWGDAGKVCLEHKGGMETDEFVTI